MNRNRLAKLAHDLREEFELNRFKFSTFFYESPQIYEDGCGTVGCSIGHLGVKGDAGWHISKGEPNTIRYETEEGEILSPRDGAAEYFDIPRSLVEFLLIPHSFQPKIVTKKIVDKFGFIETGIESSKDMVAFNLERVLDLDNKSIEQLNKELKDYEEKKSRFS